MERLENTQKTRGIGFYSPVYGIVIIVVIIGHTASKGIEYEKAVGIDAAVAVIGNALMVLLFMLSGFGLRPAPVKKNILLNFRTLLIPYYITALMVLLSKVGLAIIENRSFFEYGGEYILTYALALNVIGGGTMFGIPVQSISTLWFLWALFEARVIYNFICQIRNDNISVHFRPEEESDYSFQR